MAWRREGEEEERERERERERDKEGMLGFNWVSVFFIKSKSDGWILFIFNWVCHVKFYM
jgi:hypothetical protein